MKWVGVRGEDAEDWDRWRRMIHCGDPRREQQKGKEEDTKDDEILNIFTILC